jgi:hypothetical protein
MSKSNKIICSIILSVLLVSILISFGCNTAKPNNPPQLPPPPQQPPAPTVETPTQAPQPPSTETYQEQLPKTYTALDNVYQFTYPGNWEDITTKVYSQWKEEEDPKSPAVRPDIALGKYEDKYHAIYLDILRQPCVQVPLEGCVNQSYLKQHGFQITSSRINDRNALIATYDSPNYYEKCINIFVKTNMLAFMFTIYGIGSGYYEQVDYAYPIVIRNLKIVQQTYEDFGQGW